MIKYSVDEMNRTLNRLKDRKSIGACWGLKHQRGVDRFIEIEREELHSPREYVVNGLYDLSGPHSFEGQFFIDKEGYIIGSSTDVSPPSKCPKHAIIGKLTNLNDSVLMSFVKMPFGSEILLNIYYHLLLQKKDVTFPYAGDYSGVWSVKLELGDFAINVASWTIEENKENKASIELRLK